jgi:hypothetical protein
MSGSAAPIQAGARLFAATEADRARSPSLVLGLVVLLLVGGAAVGGTWYVREHGEWRDVFLAARWFVLGVPALLVCLEAFQESAAQGMLCLLVPLYLVWYAITRVESYWRQALVLSALALLIAEYAWLRERSVITITSEVVHRFIEYVGASIRRAGEAGVF